MNRAFWFVTALLSAATPSLSFASNAPTLHISFPRESSVLDAKRDFGAKGDGKADDTDALRDVYDFLKREFQKHGPWNSDNSYYVYLPNGTYRVSDTLIYRGESVVTAQHGDGAFDINHLHFLGESRANTIIQLQDRAPGFADPNAPKSVLTMQHPGTKFNNVPGSNWIRNLTIDVGRGNAGAVALAMQGANNSDLHCLTLRSSDGAGKYGLWFKTGSIQGYYCDVTVQGFDVGVCQPVNTEGSVAFEYLTLRDQNVAGILHTGGGMSLRKLLSQQRTNVPALKIDESGAQNMLIESELRANPVNGVASGHAVEMTRDNEQQLFARDLQTSGYENAISRAGVVAVAGRVVDEYVSGGVQTLFADTPKTSLRLPVEDTPRLEWFDPQTQWAIVDEYPSAQAAMNSGKPVVCFKARSYDLKGDVRVPASVKFINGLGADLDNGTLLIDEASTDPLRLQDMYAPTRLLASRDIIQHCVSGPLSNPNALPVTLYLENTNDNATGDSFCPPGVRVFARQIDIEYADTQQIVCNGGQMWIFGFKTENATSTPFTVKNNGALEILGGYCNATAMPAPDKQNPVLRVESGRVSAIMQTNLGGSYVKPIEETRNGETRALAHDDLPRRGGVYAPDFSIPLFVGGSERAQ